eukprot:COSAG01_NODE_5740_length_4063_cov_7.922553_1_plen_59_part_10
MQCVCTLTRTELGYVDICILLSQVSSESGCDTSILVSQPAKDINSIAPYTYVTPLRPMH